MKGTTSVVVDLKAEALEYVSGSLETVCLTAKAMTLATNVGDIPTATEVGLGLTRHECSFPKTRKILLVKHPARCEEGLAWRRDRLAPG